MGISGSEGISEFLVGNSIFFIQFFSAAILMSFLVEWSLDLQAKLKHVNAILWFTSTK